jgi:hypothetical protein
MKATKHSHCLRKKEKKKSVYMGYHWIKEKDGID